MEKKLNDKLLTWRRYYTESRQQYTNDRQMMDIRESYYNGDKVVLDKDLNPTRKSSTNVRNICHELTESQIDSTIPACRVTAIHAEDAEIAKKVEAVIRTMVERLPFDDMNDLDERTTIIQGGDFFLVEWDRTAGTHCQIGAVKVTNKHPKQFIPQAGVTEIEEMEYFFIESSVTWQSIKRRYGKNYRHVTESHPDVRTASNAQDKSPKDGKLTQIDCYYRSDKGIGKVSWIDGTDDYLEMDDDYQSRKLERCKKCGKVRIGDSCQCGSRSFELKDEDSFELEEDIVISAPEGQLPLSANIANGPEYALNPDGTVQTATDEAGNPLMDDDGYPVPVVLGEKIVKRRIPYYKPNVFPVIMRRNIKKYGCLLGISDIDVIRDQQEAIKKFGTKIDEKILKGGSFVTLPEDVKIVTDDRDLKILRLKNPQQRDMITVINVQPDISKEQIQLETNYDWAKSTLGITDSFQGKADSTAQSGTAKQFAANQSAGRMMSKRKQKWDAYARLYKMAFQFMLAYADEPVPYVTKGQNGEEIYSHFDPKELLKQDAAGEIYWNDEFIFSVDESATLASNRENLWDMLAVMYQAGAFGMIGQLDTNQIYWTLLEQTGYPSAGTVRKNMEERLANQNMMMEQQAAMSVTTPPDTIDDRTTVQKSDRTNIEV